MTAPHEQLRARLGDPALYLDDPADTARYARDWIGKYAGTAPLVVRPRSTEDVAAVLQACSELDVPVVPQAGNTGMVGGSVPRAGEVVLSVERMNAIEAFDEASATVRVQSGVVLETLQDFLAERGCDMPVDLGARGSCQIGGMIATNAGGVKVLRYGHMREQVRGLEVVLADGTVVSGLNILKKNNTGLDLKQVFIGSEGTLGVITRAVLQVQPAPEAFVHGLVIDCMSDPALTAIREAVDIPVIGPNQAAMNTANLLCHKFGSVVMSEEIILNHRKLASAYGLSHRLVSVESAGILAHEIAETIKSSPQEVHLALGRAAVTALEKGAEAIIIGCTGFLGCADGVRAYLNRIGFKGVPVIDPIPNAVLTAAKLCDLKLSHSKRAFPSPRVQGCSGYDDSWALLDR